MLNSYSRCVFNFCIPKHKAYNYAIFVFPVFQLTAHQVILFIPFSHTSSHCFKYSHPSHFIVLSITGPNKAFLSPKLIYAALYHAAFSHLACHPAPLLTMLSFSFLHASWFYYISTSLQNVFLETHC